MGRVATVTVRRVNRRLQSILLPLALASIAVGCTTFSDDDIIARVGDTELTDELVTERATAAGLPADETLDISITRQIIGSWVNETALDEGFVDASAPTAFTETQVASRYDQGLRSAGISCPAFLVTETVGEAEAAVAELRSGDAFADVFAARNIDQSLDPTVGLIGCPTLAAVLDAGDAPEAIVLLDLSAENRYGIAEILDPNGQPQVSVVIDFRPYDELDAESLPLVDATVRSVLAFAAIDIKVNPRYGYFDPVTGAVLPLG